MFAKLLLTITLLVPCGCDVLFPVVPIVPIPDPHVPVVPTPISGSLFVVVVEETGERTPETAGVLVGSSDFWHGLAKRGVTYRWYDDDIGAGLEYGKATTHRPGLLFVDKSGKVLKELALPRNVAEIDAIVKGFGK